MKQYPTLYTVAGLQRTLGDGCAKKVNGHWYPCRSVGYPSVVSSFRIAWGVFTGKYDAFQWPGDQ
jgi:hypothetical protein